MQTTRLLVVCCLSCVACGDNQHARADAGGDAAVGMDALTLPTFCWPDDGQIPAGHAVLGTGKVGRAVFEPMPATLPIEFGAQQGFDLVANVQMSGLSPGNPQANFDPTNPRTRIRAFFAATGVPLNAAAVCPWRYGYARSGDIYTLPYLPSGDEIYTLPTAVAVIFQTCWGASNLIGQQVRIELQIVDENERYVDASTTVTLAAPTSGMYPTDPTPGCPQPPERVTGTTSMSVE